MQFTTVQCNTPWCGATLPLRTAPVWVLISRSPCVQSFLRVSRCCGIRVASGPRGAFAGLCTSPFSAGTHTRTRIFRQVTTNLSVCRPPSRTPPEGGRGSALRGQGQWRVPCYVLLSGGCQRRVKATPPAGGALAGLRQDRLQEKAPNITAALHNHRHPHRKCGTGLSPSCIAGLQNRLTLFLVLFSGILVHAGWMNATITAKRGSRDHNARKQEPADYRWIGGQNK